MLKIKQNASMHRTLVLLSIVTAFPTVVHSGVLSGYIDETVIYTCANGAFCKGKVFSIPAPQAIYPGATTTEVMISYEPGVRECLKLEYGRCGFTTRAHGDNQTLLQCWGPENISVLDYSPMAIGLDSSGKYIADPTSKCAWPHQVKYRVQVQVTDETPPWLRHKK